MSDASKNPETVRLLAEQHGLSKALKLFPDGVKAAAERGLKPLGESPKGTTSITLASAHLQSRALRAREMTDLAYLSVAEGAALLRARKLSPVEWTRALLDRIAAIDSNYNAFLVVTADQALAQAKAAEAEIAKGQWRGPMHGVPYAAKDIFDIEGMATTCHSKIRQDHRASGRRLRGEKAARGRRGAARQGRAARVRDRRAGVRPALAAGAQSLEPRSSIPAARRAARARRSRPAWRRRRSAPTPAARCAIPRPAAASSA